MSVTLNTSTFFFNAKTDYLSYYKNHIVKIDEDKKLKDLLDHIADLEADFSYPKQGTTLQVNSVSVKGSVTIKKAVELFGTTMLLEPISTFRAINDIIIDDSDFIEKYSNLEEFGDGDDFNEYKKLDREYYASSTLSYNQDYFGDSMFIHANYLIEKYPEKKIDILKAIDNPNGIWQYENECNMYPKNDTLKIVDTLKDMLQENALTGYTPEKTAYYDKAEQALCSKFSVAKDEDCALETILDNIGLDKIKDSVKHPFGEFSVAFYAGSFECDYINEVNAEAKKLLEAIGANVVEFGNYNKNDGFDIAPYTNIGFKKAAEVALSAFDSGAEILVVDSKEAHFMMDQSVKKCEKMIGRDIRIPILNISQIVALAVGIVDKVDLGIDAHKIQPDFI